MAVYLPMMVSSIFFLFLAHRLHLKRTTNSITFNMSKHNLARILLYSIAFVIPFLVAALRYQVGGDWHSYYGLFWWVNQGVNTHMEVGFEAIYRITGFFTTNALYSFAIVSFLTLLPVYMTIKNYSVSPAISYFLFFTLGFYFQAFTSLRSYLAAAVCFWAFKHLKSGNMLFYVICVLVASSFHISAIIMLPVGFILRIRMRASYYMIMFLFGVLITIFHEPLFYILTSFIWTAYREILYFHISYWNILLSSIVTLGCVVYYKKMIAKPSNIILINSSIFSFLLYATMSGWTGFALSRIALYMNMFHILTIPEIINCEENKKVRILYKACVALLFCAFCFILFYVHRTGDVAGTLPYRSIFSR